MAARFELLKCVGKAVVRAVGNVVGLGFAGDVAVNLGEDVVKAWNKEKNEQQRRAELQEIVQVAAHEFRQQVAEIVREVAAGEPPQVRAAVENYLNEVPVKIRHTLKRSADPTGRTVPSDMALATPQAVVSLLPAAIGPPTIGELRRFDGHSGSVEAVAFAPDGRCAVSASQDATIRLWDVVSGQEVRRMEGHTAGVTAVAFSADGRFIISGSDDRSVRLWDAATGRELARLEGHVSGVRSVALSADGRSCLSSSGSFDDRGQPIDCTARLWDLPSGRELRCFEPHGFPICSVVFCPDGRHALSGAWDHTMRLWDVESGRVLQQFTGHTGPVWSVAVTADGRRILSGSADNTVRLWEVAGGRELRRLERHLDWVYSVAFSSDGLRALSGGDDATVRLWNVATGAQLCLLQGHTDAVKGVALSTDGHHALSAGKDGTVRLWVV